MISLRPSRLVRSLLISLEVPHHRVLIVARALAHLEHAGGAVVGIEFVFPHYFAALHLTLFAILFVMLRVIGGAET